MLVAAQCSCVRSDMARCGADMMTRARGAGLGLGNAECGVRLFSCQQWQLASSRGPVAAAPGTHMVMSSHHCHLHIGRVSPVTSVVIRVGTSVCGAQMLPMTCSLPITSLSNV